MPRSPVTAGSDSGNWGWRAFAGLALTSFVLAVPYTLALNLINLTECPEYLELKRFPWTPPGAGASVLARSLGWTALHAVLVILPMSLSLAAVGALGDELRYPWRRLASRVSLLILLLACLTLVAGMIGGRIATADAVSLFRELTAVVDPQVVRGFVLAEFRGTANMVVGLLGFGTILVEMVRYRRSVRRSRFISD